MLKKSAFLFAASLLLCVASLQAQCVDARIDAAPPSKPANASHAANNAVETNGIYQVGGPVQAPKLLHCTEPAYSEEAQEFHVSGDSILSLVVSAEGKPQDITVVSKLGVGLDENAITAVKGWRFQPALFNGLPVPVRIQLVVPFHWCENDLECKMQLAQRQAMAEAKTAEGEVASDDDSGPRRLVKQENGVYDIKGSIGTIPGLVPPKVIHAKSPKFTKAAKIARLRGECIISGVIDTDGLMKNVRVIKPLGLGLDENAVATAKEMRFKPATLNGKPIPVTLNIAFDFHIF